MRHNVFLTASLVLLASIGGVARSESASVLLEKGIYKEETEGDLKGAMEIYKKIVSQVESDRAVAAQAYYHLGMCNLKKGDKAAAAEMLEIVVSRYSDQKLATARARKNMPDISLTLPPRVLQTTPAALADNVSPTLTEITVEFNQKMTDRSWSWTGGDKYPQTTGSPAYDAALRVCRLPVKLEPGKVYWIGVNSPSHRNFKNAAGLSARWYIILFATQGSDGRPTPIPASLVDSARRINAAHRASGGANTSPGGIPIVTRTVPEAFTDNVSDSLTRIQATFSQPMQDRNWSWTGGGDTFPKTVGQPYYDGRMTTCSLPVHLEPGKVYWVGINSPSFRNFTSRNGSAAKQYVILFATRGRDGKSTPIPESLAAEARKINGTLPASTQPLR